MDFIGSPILTIIINIIAQALVSKGLLDQNSRDAFVQMVNNTLVATGSALIGIYSIYKIVELHKHKITLNAGTNAMTISTPADVKNPTPPQISQPLSTTTAPNSVQNPLS